MAAVINRLDLQNSFASTSASRFSPPSFGRMMEDDEEDFFGVGTSTGPGYRNGALTGIAGISRAGIKPLTIASLLEDKIRFVPPQHEHALEEIPYQPINVKKPSLPPQISSPVSSSPNYTASASFTHKHSVSASEANTASSIPLFPTIDPSVSWPKPHKIGAGLQNGGNTCFLNSALQVLLHTPPLIRYIEGGKHDFETCGMKAKKGFCMTCAMRPLTNASFFRNLHDYMPSPVTQNLRKIAQHMRFGRQEDSHEFLRFCIDNMQLSALYGKSPKLDQRTKESTFVHQIFGGRLRSRVRCLACGHPSDTFDSILDLSLDIGRGVESLKEAFGGFIKTDQLKGANKYKCEKCKALVIAEKSFAIDTAPMVLTIHLKRFTATGRKINARIAYPELLRLGNYMADPEDDPTYRLYGVINHSGGGPHSGHYTSHVKSSSGVWYHMNDSSISTTNGGKAPLNNPNAYVLFYCRDKGDRLNKAIYGGTTKRGTGLSPSEDIAEAQGIALGNGVRHADTNGSFPSSTSKYNGNGKRSRTESDDAGQKEFRRRLESSSVTSNHTGEEQGDGVSHSVKRVFGVPDSERQPPMILRTAQTELKTDGLHSDSPMVSGANASKVYRNPFDTREVVNSVKRASSPQTHSSPTNIRVNGGEPKVTTPSPLRLKLKIPALGAFGGKKHGRGSLIAGLRKRSNRPALLS